MIRIEKEIYDSIQHVEDIIDNIKADLEYVFDSNIDYSTRCDAKKSCDELIKRDLEVEMANISENIDDYFMHKDDFEEAEC